MKLYYRKPRKFPRWAIMNAQEGKTYHTIGEGGIVWDAQTLPYVNHIETAGFLAAGIVSYAVDQNRILKLYRHITFPTLRVNPNDTHSSLSHIFGSILINKGTQEIVDKIVFDGTLKIYSHMDKLNLVRTLFAAYDKRAYIEKIELSSTKKVDVNIINPERIHKIRPMYTADGNRISLTTRVRDKAGNEYSAKRFSLKVKDNEPQTLYVTYEGECEAFDAEEQLAKRMELIEALNNKLIITTPDNTVNEMCRFAKLRACESIFATKNGLMHAPGGGGYYAALWTNDQCEYVNPLFGYLGYDKGIEQSLNCFELFGNYISENKAIVSSIIAQGDGVWQGAGDRGDNAMYVYGLTRFLLSLGDRQKALEFSERLEKACAYIVGKINSSGVVESDADELENRFESGKANLNTNVLSYEAFMGMSYIMKELGEETKSEYYRALAAKLKSNIGRYFERKVEGYATYRYCKEEKRLRSWICMPLVAGIFDREEGTLAALFSDKLRMGSGLLTRSGDKVFWDRATLYALRGAFYSGYADDAEELLLSYCKERLLSEHAPYAVEAFPEGNQAQLSAESGLFVRIFTEGILGYKPIGFNRFMLKPSLPTDWKHMKIENMLLAGKSINIEVMRSGGKYRITLSGDVDDVYTLKDGKEIEIHL